ncbi:hypothetical protein CPB97_005367 [Podila verticillata]|nr:hypothetical protein CPB97_005367 [Podila verticillata]
MITEGLAKVSEEELYMDQGSICMLICKLLQLLQTGSIMVPWMEIIRQSKAKCGPKVCWVCDITKGKDLDKKEPKLISCLTERSLLKTVFPLSIIAK